MQFKSILAAFFLASAVSAAPIQGFPSAPSFPGLDSLTNLGKEFTDALGNTINSATGNGNGNGNGNGANGSGNGSGSGNGNGSGSGNAAGNGNSAGNGSGMFIIVSLIPRNVGLRFSRIW